MVFTSLGRIYATHTHFASMIKIEVKTAFGENSSHLLNIKGLKNSPNYALDLNGKYKPKIVLKNCTDKKIQISKFNFLNLNFHHEFNFWLRVHAILYVYTSQYHSNNLRTQLHHSGNKSRPG